MSNVCSDRRAIRTRKMIRKALSELIEEKGFNDISITDLTTRADINRGTFYLHYTDKYDLLEKVENEVLQELYEHTKEVDCMDMLDTGYINEPMPFIAVIFQYLKENASLMKAILGPRGDLAFHNKIKMFIKIKMFEEKLFEVLDKETMLIPEEYFISYILSAHLGVIQQWLESGMDKSPEDMALILTKMFLLGPSGVLPQG